MSLLTLPGIKHAQAPRVEAVQPMVTDDLIVSGLLQDIHDLIKQARPSTEHVLYVVSSHEKKDRLKYRACALHHVSGLVLGDEGMDRIEQLLPLVTSDPEVVRSTGKITFHPRRLGPAASDKQQLSYVEIDLFVIK